LLSRSILILTAALVLAGCERPADTEEFGQAELRQWRIDPRDVSADLLRSAADDPDVRRFYQRTGWTPVWTQDLTARLLETLSDADRHALEQVRFLPDRAPDAAAAREAALTRAALDYAGALGRGRVDPKRIWRIYTVPAPRLDVAESLAAALTAGESLDSWIERLAPQTDEYRALSAAYLQVREQASTTVLREIPAGELIRPDGSDPRVPLIVEALRSSNYLADLPDAERDPQRYSRPIVEAVQRLQADRGIDPDGIVGPDTLELLNTGPADRARQLAVNLERRRWLDRSPPATRIDVNTAANFLDYWRDGQRRDRRRVITGQPDWTTPQLGSPIFQLVANPSWTVPESIYEKEIAPRGAAYLWRNNMVWRNGRVVQLPGPGNALGAVKFDMKNDHAIYLHDTPFRQLFASADRHLSHGCVRVEDAIGFARMLAADDGTIAEFDEAMMIGDPEQYVPLKSHLPVRLLYHTAYVDGGKVRLRPDTYAWDDEVADALGLPKRARRPPRKVTGDIGP